MKGVKKVFMAVVLLIMLFPIHSYAQQARVDEYVAYCDEIGARYGISSEMLQAMCFYESSWNPSAVSSHGAIGLMQIKPDCHRDRMNRLGVTDLTDPYSNILVGADILKEYSYKYEAYEALVAYNCGEYSKTFRNVLNGSSNRYADRVLKKTREIEMQRGK